MHKLPNRLGVAALTMLATLPTKAAEVAYSSEYQACTSQASSTAQMWACTNEERKRPVIPALL
jgi:hypothetical protein